MLATCLLIGLVTFMSCGMAYIHDARLKVLLYALPLPMTAGLIVSGLPFEITHVVGMGTIWVIMWMCWLLHAVWRINIILSIGIILAAYLSAVALTVQVLPSRGEPWEASWFYLASGLLFALALLLLAFLPEKKDPGHRSSLPFYLKFSCILVIVIAVVMAKDYLRGFMVTFPYITIFGLYESRYSLYTFAWRNSLFFIAAIPSVIVFRILYPDIANIGWALAGMWAIYFPLYIFVNRELIFGVRNNSKVFSDA